MLLTRCVRGATSPVALTIVRAFGEATKKQESFEFYKPSVSYLQYLPGFDTALGLSAASTSLRIEPFAHMVGF
jgi:hypothetical protein